MVDSEDKKSATDILIELNQNVKLLLGYYKNMDNNVKLILSRLNEKKTTEPTKEVISQPQQSVKAASDSNSETITIPRKNGLVNLNSSNASEQLKNNLSSDSNSNIKLNQEQGSKSFSITQVVQKADGSPIKLAGIEITDGDGNLVYQTRAQTNGKYILTNVVAGNYKIRVFKLNGSKGKIEFTSSLQISQPETGNVVELTPLVIPSD